jgi:hypothetical protein
MLEELEEIQQEYNKIVFKRLEEGTANKKNDVSEKVPSPRNRIKQTGTNISHNLHIIEEF